MRTNSVVLRIGRIGWRRCCRRRWVRLLFCPFWQAGIRAHVRVLGAVLARQRRRLLVQVG